ncbi:clasp N terminal-domain-containing protein [Panaeolus papilionaceus]|nr:clasp N terminal-domain-containing protein [Panaeolus papilionaceus]
MDSGAFSQYEKLLNQCKSNDVDVKVDALPKLQAEFEKGGVEITDPDAIISLLKSTLKTSNLHLINATLSALPIILTTVISQGASNNALTASTSSTPSSSSIDIPTLRLALNAFLPPGGVIDRLGDKERAQVKARDALVILAGFALRASPTSAIPSKGAKNVETPLALFERFLKENGLASKVWKVREQSILTLVHARRAYTSFPIRPYLSLLVDCLEDTDPHVRDCARVSVVELFSGPGVTDAARADLKKELTKKGVRKTIVDDVLAKLLSSSLAAAPSNLGDSQNGEPAKKEYIPPSLALQNKRPRVASQGAALSRSVSTTSAREPSRPPSRAAVTSPPPPPTPTSESSEIQAVYIASTKDLENEFAAMQKPFEGKETEHNWLARDQAIQRVRGMIKGEVHSRYLEAFLLALKEGFMQWSLKTVASLRTTVAINTCLLYSELAVALGSLLDPHCDLLLTNLLKMAGFTKKITAQQSQATVTALISNTSAQPRVFIPLFWQTLQEKTVQARSYAVGHMKHYIEVHGQRAKNAIEGTNMLEILEKSLKRALADPNPASRESARHLFWDFEAIWKDRGQAIMETLDATARKQLEKVSPNPGAVAGAVSTPQVSKKSSVAAAIAASRAKAKAIATAPPSLRHQATSSSQTTLARTRPTSPTVTPKSTVARPSSPLSRTSTSPASPNRRAVSATLTRTASSPNATTTHTRTPSGGSDKSARAISPSLSDQAIRRRQSSPLSGTVSASTIRKALTTALPPSPASSVGQVSPTPRANRTGPVPLPPRESTSQIMRYDDSLLMAQTVPIPDGDTDSDEGASINLMSFSTPFEKYGRGLPSSKTQSLTRSPMSNSRATASTSNALSSGSMTDAATQQPVVEDALRARAEQAESAAERLLELVDDDGVAHPSLPPAFQKNGNGLGMSHATPKAKPPLTSLSKTTVSKAPPKTPNNRASNIMRQAAMFQDSPVQNGRPTVSLLDVLQSSKQETGWSLKRKTLRSKVVQADARPIPDRLQELEQQISELGAEKGTVETLKRLALFCAENSVVDVTSPPLSPHDRQPGSPTPLSTSSLVPLHTDVWEKSNIFDKIFKALITFIEASKDEEQIVYGLIVVWEMLESQSTYVEGKESEILTMLLRVRYCNKIDVLEGTNAIRNLLTTKLDPVYGLTTMHASLRLFHTEPPPSPEEEDVKATTYAFGLMALGKFVLRLPAEIAEEELPRLKVTLISGLNDKTSLIIRESAAAAIISAQYVLRDETHLFALLDGLTDEKKNLLTYLFDKHGARGQTDANTSIDKLQREIRRLDTRTSTPLRS